MASTDASNPDPRYPERFEDLELRCTEEIDGETETITFEDRDGKTHTHEQPATCGAALTFREHYAGMRHLDGFEGKVHVLACPDCGAYAGVCPVCTGDDAGPGFFRGESTGEAIPCHVCNQQEINARMRHHGHTGRFP